MNINYDYYHIFYYAAKYRSLTRAAAVLGSNQPNVSRTITKLEHALGCKLFTRSRRGLSLTAQGAALLAHVELAEEQLQAAEEELAGGLALQSGTVSIGASETALRVFLLDKLNAFRTLHPGVQLRLANHSTPQAISALRQGSIDLAVVTTPTEAHRPLREQPLMPFEEILIAGPAFAHLAQKPLSLRELEDLPLVCLGAETMTYRFYSDLFRKHAAALHPATEAATADQILPLVQYNLGVGFVPEPLVRAALAAGEVTRLSLRESIPERQVVLLQDSHKPLTPAAKEFVALLSE